MLSHPIMTACYNRSVKIFIEKFLITIFCLSIIGGLVYMTIEYRTVSKELSLANQKYLDTTKASLDKEAENGSVVSQKDSYIVFLEKENASLNTQLTDEKDKGKAFEEKVATIGDTIAEIQKIQNTDAELLKKYSKVYFLNENYKPASLSTINDEYIVNKKTVIEINSKVLPFLNDMIQASASLGSTSTLRIESGYRSFEEQKNLKTTYKVLYGAGANKFSADQGYSEHQLGTTVDVSTEKLGFKYTSFGDSPTYTWMKNHAHEYGFIISYPKGNTHYQYEPWHWRFVGIKLATDLHDKNMNFYDMEQRIIDSYISKLFDYN